LAGTNRDTSGFPDQWFYERKAEHRNIEGKPAPALELTGWKNGVVTKADLQGKIVVLDIWATWCGPCIKALPHTDQMAAKFKDQGVVVIAVCGSGFDEDGYEKILEQTNYKGPVAVPDNPDKFIKDWAVLWWPTFTVIDRNGIIRAVGLTPEGAENAVKKLLAEDTAGKPAL
jgi:thiol-disulfide isomerase/thioredoxin